VAFCKSRAGNIWHEVVRTQMLHENHRKPRHAGAQCCGCGQSPNGPPGPPGMAGPPGTVCHGKFYSFILF
jgi:hypothetical protein